MIFQIHMYLERHCDTQEINDNSRGIDVADDHDVEMTEELQFFQRHSRLPISLRGFL